MDGKAQEEGWRLPTGHLFAGLDVRTGNAVTPFAVAHRRRIGRPV